jgi:hypothetical protein
VKEVLQEPQYRLDGMLVSVFGRSLRTRLPTDRPPEEAAERVYLFAHETLRSIAEEELGGVVPQYRQRIHAWADDYRAQGWPEGTPRYLYGLMGTSWPRLEICNGLPRWQSIPLVIIDCLFTHGMMRPLSQKLLQLSGSL